jgi:DNA polymerase-3 subunit delta
MHEQILKDWKNNNFKSTYWLEGEEPYFIDKITDYAEHHILNEADASFNLTILYGKDVDCNLVINACKQ